MKKLLFVASSLFLAACGAENKSPVAQVAAWTPIPIPPPPALATPVRTDFGACSQHVANAGTFFECPANRFVVGISDNQEVFGRFETIQCCALRLSTGQPVQPVYASQRIESTAYGMEKTCPGNHFMKGVGFDSGGGAGTMLCYRMASFGRPIVKTGFGTTSALYARGSAQCPPHRIASGLGDNITADGAIDNIRCQPAAAN